jgi:hypothetical protein
MIKLNVPISYAACTPEQLKYLSKLMLSKLTAAEIKLMCFLRFSGLKLLKKKPVVDDSGQICYLFKHKKHGVFLLDIDRLTNMHSRLNWIDQDVTTFHLPSQIRRYKACNSLLYGMPLDAWLMLDLIYSRYAQTRQPALLSKMMAIIYTRPGESFNDGQYLAKRARRFRFVPAWKKHLVFLWYTGVKLWLMHKYYYVFAGADGNADTPVDEMIMGLIAALNEGNVANNHIIKTTDVHEVLFELNRKIENAKTR